MDKKKSVLNVTVSVAFRLLLLVADFLVRRVLIDYLGEAVNGINSLYISILEFLAVAELGVGTAITFCMYKPIVEGDNNKVSAFYHLFTKLYLIIAAIILVGGCIVMPLLPYLATGYSTANVNLYLTFGLMLVSVIIPFIFCSKTSLINAYKNNYITTAVASVGKLLQCGLQIAVIIYTRSFVWFMVCRLLSAGLQWLVTEIIARAKHGSIVKNRQKVDDESKKLVVKNIKAMFMHKIGYALVNTADSVIISLFLGVVLLGRYTNYTVILTAMAAVLNLVFTSLTSVVGHMSVEEDKSEVKKYHKFFHTLNFIIGLVFYLGYFSIIDNVVSLLSSEQDLLLSKSVSFIITLNGFVQFMRQSTLLFRDATGTFYNDRWKALFEGLLNIGLSVLFVLVFPEDYKIVGVIVATILTNLFICHIVEPHVLYKYALDGTAREYYLKNYIYIAVFCAALLGLNFALVSTGNLWTTLLANGFIAVGIAIAVSLCAVLIDRNFRSYFKRTLLKVKQRLQRK